METAWRADRTTLWTLRREHPEWRIDDFAATIHRSSSWVGKWLRRFRTTSDCSTAVQSRSRARHHPPTPLSTIVIDRILAIRDQPPEHLGRVPGPKAILYYLQRDTALPEGLRLPRSTRTIWRILRDHARIASQPRPSTEPVPRPEPLSAWQLDFKDVTSAEHEPGGKRLHRIEVLNTIDVGTSILVDAQARTDFTADTALAAVAHTLTIQGVPDHITIDRDPRWVGSQQQRDFPSALVRFLTCVGIEVCICPPHRPDKNGFVERYHRTYDTECLQRTRPATLAEVQSVTSQFQQHYNEERPHQGRNCHNQPPKQAFPALPARPGVPTLVDPDRWLQTVDGRRYLRRIHQDGAVKVNSQRYYVSQRLSGHFVNCRVDAATKCLVIEHEGREVKQCPIRGTGSPPLSFSDFVVRLQEEARSDARRAHVTRLKQHSFA